MYKIYKLASHFVVVFFSAKALPWRQQQTGSAGESLPVDDPLFTSWLSVRVRKDQQLRLNDVSTTFLADVHASCKKKSASIGKLSYQASEGKLLLWRFRFSHCEPSDGCLLNSSVAALEVLVLVPRPLETRTSRTLSLFHWVSARS